MIAKLLICYALAILLAVAGTIALKIYFKKNNIRFSVLNFLAGIASFVAILFAMLMFIMYAFSEESTLYMTAFMSEAVYKIAAAILFLVLVGILRYFLLNAIYFSKGREAQGSSFLAGFGMTGVYLIAFYCLFSFAFVAFTAANAPLITLTLESTLRFADHTIIPVFTPFESHVFVTILFLIYTALMLVTARFMTQHANLPYKWTHTLVMYLLTAFCEVCATAIILFAVAKMSYIWLIVIVAILAVLSGISVRLLYKYKDELPYEKQFD